MRPENFKWLNAARVLNALLLAAAAIFYALHFLHLQADFPNHSPWMDWAKYTDEGWYGNAAIEQYLRGSWYVPGDFNPATALPVWPMLLALVFKFTGVSLAAARALTVSVFGVTLAAAWLLVRRNYSALAASLAVFLLAVSPFCYAFTRLAILEPLLVLLTMLALLVASYTAPGRYWPLMVIGLLIPLMVLTKTTAIFLVPAIFLLMLLQLRVREFILQAGAVTLLAAGSWCAYFFLLVRPHYLADYQYLFSANGYTSMKVCQMGSILLTTFKSGMWMDRVLFPAFVVLVVWALAMLAWRRSGWLQQNKLLAALLVWALGYFAFLAYHNNMQPRYYLVIAVPMTLALAIGAEILWLWLAGLPRENKFLWLRIGLIATIAVVLVFAVGTDLRLQLSFVRAPEYTFLNATRTVGQLINADPKQNRLVLSISGNEMSLMNGVQGICDDFGTMQLDDRIAAYKPGWYLVWNVVEDDKQESLDKFYRMERVLVVPAMDDPDRNVLILYKLIPLGEVPALPVRHRRRRVRLLDTSFSPD